MTTAFGWFSVLLLLSCGCSLQSRAQTSEMQSDRAHRDVSIHWPAAYDPSVAPVFSHNELLIHSDCHRTFARLADATNWPNWLVIVKKRYKRDARHDRPGRSLSPQNLQQPYPVPALLNM